MATMTSTITSTSQEDNTIPRGPVTATLKFFSPPPDNTPPFNYVETPPAGLPQRNFTDAEHAVPIADARGHESQFRLDTHAFQLVTGLGTAEQTNFTSDASIAKTYYPEVEALLLATILGANRVHIFDHTVRRAAPAAHRAPVTRVHIDQTLSSALARVGLHLPDEAAKLCQGRVRIVNVWRPLNGPVESFPLAFADSTSVPDDAVVSVQHRYPDRVGETAAVCWTEGQRWWYWSGVGNDERVLLQCFDSEKGARVPHSAFVDPRTRPGARGRESIEVRALVFG